MVLARWAGAKELAIASPVGHRQGPLPYATWQSQRSKSKRAKSSRSAVEPLIGYFVWRPFRAPAADAPQAASEEHSALPRGPETPLHFRGQKHVRERQGRNQRLKLTRLE